MVTFSLGTIVSNKNQYFVVGTVTSNKPMNIFLAGPVTGHKISDTFLRGWSRVAG
jgi:hypothetical protein